MEEKRLVKWQLINRWNDGIRKSLLGNHDGSTLFREESSVGAKMVDISLGAGCFHILKVSLHKIHITDKKIIPLQWRNMDSTSSTKWSKFPAPKNNLVWPLILVRTTQDQFCRVPAQKCVLWLSSYGSISGVQIDTVLACVPQKCQGHKK